MESVCSGTYCLYNLAMAQTNAMATILKCWLLLPFYRRNLSDTERLLGLSHSA